MRWPFARAARPGAAPPPRGALFVLGAARSGTTILQNALNHSREIFLLGEPDLHRDDGSPGFAARYETMHRLWRNQPNKSSALPITTPADGTWREHLDGLARHHRWVGSKIVVNPTRDADALAGLLHFHAHHFYDARYLFVLRDPAATLRSTMAFQRAFDTPPESAATVLGHIARTIALFTRMLRTFPNVRAVAQEDIGPATFDDLGRWLDVPLDGAAGYYDDTRLGSYDMPDLDAHAAQGLAALRDLHEALRAVLRKPIERPQLEQNYANATPNHLTAIGAIDARATLAALFLADPPAAAG